MLDAGAMFGGIAPIAGATTGGLTIVAPELYFWNLNHNHREYRDVPDEVKMLNYLIPMYVREAKDGSHLHEDGTRKIEEFISTKFNLDKEQRNFAINIFQKAKDDNVSFEAYAKQLYSLLKQSPNSLLIFYELLIVT